VNTGPGLFAESQPEKRSFFSPLVLALIGVVVLGGLGIAGLAGAYMLGAFGKGTTIANTSNTSNTATPTPSNSPGPAIKAEMVSIPGGTFRMGRNEGGRDNEKPEHEVTVQPFMMDKTEVTNAEYYEFVQQADHKPVPTNWENGKPVPGQEQMPVRYITYNDAVAFAQWRSKRDGVTYRLPTEEEWEYAARNGAKNNLYPWGDKYDPKCAVLDQDSNQPKKVGTQSCPDDWGVVDLIGNVFEWTSTPAALYPGSAGSVKPSNDKRYMVRGGGAIYKSTGQLAISSTFRHDVAANTSLPELGFRLVRNQ
jgi:formylglycine-generating enzyme required for sulfatase activity